eukprot:1158765-Pelagomonas_calceolata.AAC.1
MECVGRVGDTLTLAGCNPAASAPGLINTCYTFLACKSLRHLHLPDLAKLINLANLHAKSMIGGICFLQCLLATDID